MYPHVPQPDSVVFLLGVTSPWGSSLWFPRLPVIPQMPGTVQVQAVATLLLRSRGHTAQIFWDSSGFTHSLPLLAKDLHWSGSVFQFWITKCKTVGLPYLYLVSLAQRNKGPGLVCKAGQVTLGSCEPSTLVQLGPIRASPSVGLQHPARWLLGECSPEGWAGVRVGHTQTQHAACCWGPRCQAELPPQPEDAPLPAGPNRC